MKDRLKIDKGIEMPMRASKSKYRDAATRMCVGDSVFFGQRNEAMQLQAALRKMKKAGAIREMQGGFRLFCVEYQPRKYRLRDKRIKHHSAVEE